MNPSLKLNFPEDWELPDYSWYDLAPKRHSKALVIPVLNEGERIKTQLNAIIALDLPLDIIIADGGSTDSATDPELLKEMGVSKLVVKEGEGAMSAQMRIAFAVTIQHGYDHIINMDGNNKDKAEDIQKFIDALDDGVDCVLPTRFRAGGIHIRTPLIRVIAIKYFHAPLMSLAAGVKMTDTTNSFRGYTRRLLLDERLQMFRSVFMRYNLPYYLSYRAAKLKYVIREVPTTRIYPVDGSVPTKITGFKSQFGIIVELFKVITGQYDPK